jgi:hypothetical protein
MEYMFVLKKDNLNNIFSFQEGLSCAVLAKPSEGTTSFIIDIVSRIIQDNDSARIKYITSDRCLDNIYDWFSRTFNKKPLISNEQKDSLKSNTYFKRCQFEQIINPVDIDQFLINLDKDHNRSPFNVLVVDYPQSIFCNTDKEEYLFMLIRWSQIHKVQLFFSWKITNKIKHINSIAVSKIINTILLLEKVGEDRYLTIQKNIKFLSYKFLLKLNYNSNNYFEDYYIGEERRRIFNKDLSLKNKSFNNSFLVCKKMDDEIPDVTWDFFFKNYISFKSNKLKKEMFEYIFIDEKSVNLDVLNYYILCNKLFGYNDINYIRTVMNDSHSVNKINVNFFTADNIIMLKIMFNRMKIDLKKFTEIFVNIDEYDLFYLIQLMSTFQDILYKEKEHNVNFFNSDLKNINSSKKIFNVFRETSQSMMNYLELIKNSQFLSKQSDIKYIERFKCGHFRLKVIESVNDLFNYSNKLSNCLGSQRYINNVIIENEHLATIYLNKVLIGAVHFDDNFEIIEIKKRFNKEFSKEDVGSFSKYLKSMLKSI